MEYNDFDIISEAEKSLEDEDDDAEIAVTGNEHHFITGVVFVQALEDRPEIRIAVSCCTDVTAQDRATAFHLQGLNRIAGFDDDEMAVQIGLVIFSGTDILESSINQFS